VGMTKGHVLFRVPFVAQLFVLCDLRLIAVDSALWRGRGEGVGG
jgi:hypothetical protein